MDFIKKEIESYVKSHTQLSSSDILSEIEQLTYEKTDYPQMLSGHVVGRFLKLMTCISRAKYVLEIGTFTGYSTLCLAEGLCDSGRIYTCEIDPQIADLARSCFEKSPFFKRIELLVGPALNSIMTIEQKEFDLIFIDADKINYINYYELALKKLRTGGVMIIDNCLWSGRVLNPTDDSSQTIAELNKEIVSDARVENVFLTVRDGLQVLIKK